LFGLRSFGERESPLAVVLNRSLRCNGCQTDQWGGPWMI
jgi:hypothetical protein